MLTKAELKALKVGDEVAWEKGGQWYVTTVSKVSSTSILTADHERWSMAHGKRYGSTQGRSAWLSAVTPEYRAAALAREEHDRLVKRIVRESYETPWSKRDLATLRRVVAALEGPVPLL
jgi:hypothetical protein